MAAPDEFKFVLTNGDEVVLTRREGLQYALSGALTFSSVPGGEPPGPDPEPDGPVWTGLDRHHSAVVMVKPATVDGYDDSLFLKQGGAALYDHRGHVRRVGLKPDGQWDGTQTARAMVRCDGAEYGIRKWTDANADHDGATILGGCFDCPDMTWQTPQWGRCYQSEYVDEHGKKKAAVTGAFQVRECSFKNALIEGVRLNGCFDGIQFASGTRGRSGDIRIFNCCATVHRDDFVEDDPGLEMTVERNYAEVFVFFSCRGGSKTDLSGTGAEAYLLDNLVVLPAVNYANVTTSGNAIKIDKNSIVVNMKGNAFFSGAKPNHQHLAGGVFADVVKHKTKLGKSEDNLFGWLGQGENPHPLPRGFRLIAGDEAHQELAKRQGDWWPGFPGHRLLGDPPLTS